VIRGADIARVAGQESLPLWLAQAIAADVVLSEQLRGERLGRERFPGRERCSNELALLGHLLAKEEQDES
jgi:hypothetical protein